MYRVSTLVKYVVSFFLYNQLNQWQKESEQL